MTRYRERSPEVEVTGSGDLWLVEYLDLPNKGRIEQHSTESLNRKFEVVPTNIPASR